MTEAAKFIEFDVIIKGDGTVVHNVTNRQEGADCRAIKRITQRMGQEVSDETTGPFCDRQNERG
jgi:hypothetical protein